MRMVAHNAKVADVGGLYYDLVKRDFEVENVATDKGSTFVYLRDGEGKDPLPVVREWVGRPVPPPTRKVIEERTAVEMALREDRERKAAEERARLEAEAKARREAAEKAAAEAAEAAKPKPPSLISRVFRKLW